MKIEFKKVILICAFGVNSACADINEVTMPPYAKNITKSYKNLNESEIIFQISAQSEQERTRKWLKHEYAKINYVECGQSFDENVRVWAKPKQRKIALLYFDNYNLGKDPYPISVLIKSYTVDYSMYKTWKYLGAAFIINLSCIDYIGKTFFNTQKK